MKININFENNFFKPRKKNNIDFEPTAPPYYEQILLLQMNSNQSFCFGGRHYSQTVNKNEYEKVNPKTKELIKTIKGTCNICGRKKSQIFTK